MVDASWGNGMSSRHERGWDSVYHQYSPDVLPWELGRPRRVLVELVESGQLAPCRALDLCCGAGTNPVYLAEKGFEVTVLDISDRAVEITKEKADGAVVDMNLVVGDFLNLPFRSQEFEFAFDFGCFHHVGVQDRRSFVSGLHRVLKPRSLYLLVCFSYRNGPSWHHFTKRQIIDLFDGFFEIERIKHISSVERDRAMRYFYEVLMRRK